MQKTLESSASPAAGQMVAVAALGLMLRLWWVHRYPVIFGGDTVLRLVNYRYIVLSYQLPFTQAVVHYLHAVTPDPIAVRWVMSLVGAVSGVAFYLLAAQLLPRLAAFSGALLFTVNPFVLPLSTVPYQEILMVTGLLFAFYGAFSDRWLIASLGLGAACLTRYESWLACPVLFVWYLRTRGVTARRVAESAALFGWAPLGWIIYNRALTPAGSFAVESHLTIARFVRWAFVGYVALLHSPLPVTALAILGVVVFVTRGLWRDPRYLALAGYVGLFLVALLFSAHGTQPDPERRVTDREAHVIIVALGFAATLGLTAIPRYRAAVLAVCLALSIWMADRYFASQTSEPQLAISYQAAGFIDSVVRPGEQVAVLAKPIDGVRPFLEAATRAGPEARSAAVATLNRLETTPPNFQRILVHSRLGKAQLRSYASLIQRWTDRDEVLVPAPAMDQPPAWIVRWNDFRATSKVEQELNEQIRTLKPVWTRTDGDYSLTIYRPNSILRPTAPP